MMVDLPREFMASEPVSALVALGAPGLPAPVIRAQIYALEAVLSLMPGAVFGDSALCPVRHTWADGIYVREISIPQGVVLTGKVHKYAHPNFLMVGEVIVVTEFEGREHLRAPCAMISRAGTKRAVFALQDTVWVTVHACPVATDNLEDLEGQIVAQSHEEFEAWCLEQEEESP